MVDKAAFWRAVWTWLDVPYDGTLDPALVDGEAFPGARWFPAARLNYAEAIVSHQPDDAPAIIFRNEAGVRRTLTFAELRAGAARLQPGLVAAGVGPGTRIGAIMPNVPEAIMAMLAATALGATWSSVSPDFGVDGILDRLAQVRPTLLFAADGYHFGGKTHAVLVKVAAVVDRLDDIAQTVVLGYLEPAPSIAAIRNAVMWDDFAAPTGDGALEFTRLPFDHPLFILYTSGTTGPPKCIVHSPADACSRASRSMPCSSICDPATSPFSRRRWVG